MKALAPALVLATAGLSFAPATAESVEASVSSHLAALREALDPRAANALARVDGTGRQLLAARAYLRAGPDLAGRWSWSEPEIEAWRGSPGQAALDAAVARVRAAFEAANPGYSLHVSPEVRSLEVQLERWNTNPSIAAASEGLAEAAAVAIQSLGFPAPGTPLAQAAFGDFLRGFAPQPTPPLAAPGLSAHGQMRAVDFVVMQGERIVAGAVTADIPALWIADDWGARLHAAVAASGTPFTGPLQVPDEPWHYDYRP